MRFISYTKNTIDSVQPPQFNDHVNFYGVHSSGYMLMIAGNMAYLHLRYWVGYHNTK